MKLSLSPRNRCRVVVGEDDHAWLKAAARTLDMSLETLVGLIVAKARMDCGVDARRFEESLRDLVRLSL